MEMTSIYQPLDISINGIIKQKAKFLWRQEVTKNPLVKITDADSIRHFLKAISYITPINIAKSFNKSCFFI